MKVICFNRRGYKYWFEYKCIPVEIKGDEKNSDNDVHLTSSSSTTTTNTAAFADHGITDYLNINQHHQHHQQRIPPSPVHSFPEGESVIVSDEHGGWGLVYGTINAVFPLSSTSTSLTSSTSTSSTSTSSSSSSSSTTSTSSSTSYMIVMNGATELSLPGFPTTASLIGQQFRIDKYRTVDLSSVSVNNLVQFTAHYISEENERRTSDMQQFAANTITNHHQQQYQQSSSTTANATSRGTLTQSLSQPLSQSFLTIFSQRGDDINKNNIHISYPLLPRLREIIIEGDSPRLSLRYETVWQWVEEQRTYFNSSNLLHQEQKLALLLEIQKLLQQCNSDQLNAIRLALNSQDLAIIQGLPGTGKTLVIVVITMMFVLEGKRVLISSHTHNAIDNVLMKLAPFGRYNIECS